MVKYRLFLMPHIENQLDWSNLDCCHPMSGSSNALRFYGNTTRTESIRVANDLNRDQTGSWGLTLEAWVHPEASTGVSTIMSFLGDEL